MKNLLQHSRDKKFVQHYFHSLKIFHVQDAKANNFVDTVNKSNALAYQLACLEVSVQDKDIVTTLLIGEVTSKIVEIDKT